MREAEAAALDVVVCLVGTSDTEHAVREMGKDEPVNDGSRDQRADEGDDGQQEGIRVEGLSFLFVVGYHLIHSGGKCGKALGVFVLLESGDKLVCEVADAVVVGNARAHLVVGGDVEVALLRCEEEDDGAVCAAVRDAVDDGIGNLAKHLFVRVLDRADEDANAVRLFIRGKLCVECLLLGIGDEVGLVDDAHSTQSRIPCLCPPPPRRHAQRH